MALYSYTSYSKSLTIPQGKTEFEILKDSHKFLRNEEDDENQLSWEEKLASKYYSSLYREFAVCDLKHYKSGNFALRWRTEDEVLAETGESTCGNTRCKHYNHGRPEGDKPHLSTLELPFAYSEHGENKSALVKVVLCARCVDKLMWKRRRGKDEGPGAEADQLHQESGRAKVKEEELELDVLESDEKDPSKSHRVNESSGRHTRIDRWDKEDRERKTDWNKARRSRSHSRSRSPQPHAARKRSKHT
ncbi:folate-sensitive fragile site protein Fra10Ac1-domain-containing protein [Lentinula detonsa]|uniref:Folate-sensitive fragile site protein Fra10Ac1-domain-containing protein n=1 Tax=Lentinula detonsa TaxID=2804962 RepID=A0A9W8NRB0_9AGAR|nr:folate-sensitive fragile site protein Fra10Ac1-domain-containing protein [Lentinula detonsa]